MDDRAPHDRARADRPVDGVPLSHVLILCGLALALFFFNLGARPLWDIDEGMHAATSKDMVLTGDWVTPTLNGEPFYDKPPLFNWLVALSFLVLGFTEFAARLPEALLGTACVAVTYVLGSRMFGRTVGLLGGVILATSLEYVVLSRVVVHDMVLVFFVTLGLLFFWLALDSDTNRRAHVILFAASAGLAVLAKGPLGLVLLGLVVGPFLVLTKRLRFVRALLDPWAVLVFLLVVCPWYVLMAARNPDYTGYFLVQQNLINFVSAESRHPEPFYFYLPILVGGFFPWSAVLPVALFRAFRQRHAQPEHARLFLLVWVTAIFVFFSLASSKLLAYVVPVFPAAALLVALAWNDLASERGPGLRRGVLVSLVSLFTVVVLFLLYLWLYRLDYLQGRYRLESQAFLAVIASISGGLLAAVALCVARRYWSSFAALAATIAVLVVVFSLLVVPPLNPYRSSLGLARRLDAELPVGAPLVFYHRMKDSALFYTDRQALVVTEPRQLLQLLAEDRPVYCVIDSEFYEPLERVKAASEIVDREGRKLVIWNGVE